MAHTTAAMTCPCPAVPCRPDPRLRIPRGRRLPQTHTLHRAGQLHLRRHPLPGPAGPDAEERPVDAVGGGPQHTAHGQTGPAALLGADAVRPLMLVAGLAAAGVRPCWAPPGQPPGEPPAAGRSPPLRAVIHFRPPRVDTTHRTRAERVPARPPPSAGGNRPACPCLQINHCRAVVVKSVQNR